MIAAQLSILDQTGKPLEL